MFVDDDAVVAFEAAFARKPVFRQRADSDDHEVGGYSLAVAQGDALRLLRPRDRRDPNAKPQARAKRAVSLGKKGRQMLGDRAPHRPCDLDHRHLAPESDGGRGDFEPDEARADDHDLSRPMQRLADRERVRNRAQDEDAGQPDAGNVEPPVPGAGRKDQRSIGDGAALARLDPLAGPVDARGAHAEPEIDAMVAEERFGPERQAMDIHLAFEKSLGERRPLVGQFLFV